VAHVPAIRAWRIDDAKAIPTVPRDITWTECALDGWLAPDARLRLFLDAGRVVAATPGRVSRPQRPVWWDADIPSFEDSPVPVLAENCLDDAWIAATTHQAPKRNPSCYWGNYHRVSLLRRDGTVARRVAAGPGAIWEATVSPDGSWLLYKCCVWLSPRPRIVLIHLANGTRYMLTGDRAVGSYFPGHCFSPDSSKLAILLGAPGGTQQGYVILLQDKTGTPYSTRDTSAK